MNTQNAWKTKRIHIYMRTTTKTNQPKQKKYITEQRIHHIHIKPTTRKKKTQVKRVSPVRGCYK